MCVDVSMTYVITTRNEEAVHPPTTSLASQFVKCGYERRDHMTKNKDGAKKRVR